LKEIKLKLIISQRKEAANVIAISGYIPFQLNYESPLFPYHGSWFQRLWKNASPQQLALFNHHGGP